MAEKQNTSSESGGKKVVSRWDRIFLLVCLVIFLFVGLQKCGGKMLNKTEQIEILDNPHK